MQIIVEQNGNGRSAVPTPDGRSRLLVQIIPLTSIIRKYGYIYSIPERYRDTYNDDLIVQTVRRG